VGSAGSVDSAVTGSCYTSVPLEHVFPLRECELAGAAFPCPAEPEAVLRALYGADFMRPRRGIGTDSEALPPMDGE
jgi:hypothetical protein